MRRHRRRPEPRDGRPLRAGARPGTILVGLLLATIALTTGLLGPAPRRVRAAPVDLSGVWIREDGGIARMVQEGNRLTAVHLEVTTQVRDVFGFRPGDEHFVATVDGRSIRGKMRSHLPVGWKTRCPDQWAHLSDIELAVSPDGNTLEGRWKKITIGSRGCQQEAEEWLPRRYTRQAAVSEPPGELTVTAIVPLSVRQFELILDASGSMAGKVGRQTKLQAAKDVLAEVVANLPEDVEVALRVYGHRIAPGRAGACQDSELVFPFARVDKPRLLERVRAMRALGTTPIAYSLRQVARDFGSSPGEKMVILVTDGKEECGGNPGEAAAELLATGLRLQVNIVGFALADAETKAEVQRVAELTGGRFFDAANAAGLRRAIEQALAVPYEVLDAMGTKVVGGGRVGQGAITLPAGAYRVVVHAAGAPLAIPDVRVAPGKSTTVELEKQGQRVGSRVHGP
jgi:hypothetical protein